MIYGFATAGTFRTENGLGMGNRKGTENKTETDNEQRTDNEQGTENEQEIYVNPENVQHNLKAGISIDEDVYFKGQNSPEDLYEEIEFPERPMLPGSETGTENTEMKTQTSSHAIQTVATHPERPAVKDKTVVKEDTENTIATDDTEVEYGNIFTVPGEGFTNEEPNEWDPKAKASKEVSLKVSMKLKRKLTKRVKELNLDQRIVKVSSNSHV